MRFMYFDCHFADVPVKLGLGSFNNLITKALNEFLTKEELQDESVVKEVRKDIRTCYYRYKTTPQEYFLFKFRHKKHEERDSYISDHMIMNLVANKSGRKVHDVELNNKFNFYRLNKLYFKRKAFFFNSQTPFDEFKNTVPN